MESPPSPMDAAARRVERARPRILFVDDDLAVLGRLNDELRRQRSCWHLKFVPTAAEAAAELEQRRYDVVVTDARIVRADGRSFLSFMQRRYPATARILLSQQSGRAHLLANLPVAHQMLHKPCDARQLELVVERALAVCHLLQNDNLRAVIGGIERLPSLPQAYVDLTEAMSQPEAADHAAIVEIVARDPAMSARLLQIVNSAYFGLPQRISRLEQAVTYLGLDLLCALTLSSHLFSGLDGRTLGDYGLARLEESSLLVARLVRRFLAGRADADDGFIAGLLHDVGRLVLVAGLEDGYRPIVRRAAEEGVPIEAAERKVLGVSHAEVGAYLLGIWGLPPAVVEAVAGHHVPGALPPERRALACAVHVADLLVQQRLGTAMQPADTDRLAPEVNPAVAAQWRRSAELELARLAP